MDAVYIELAMRRACPIQSGRSSVSRMLFFSFATSRKRPIATVDGQSLDATTHSIITELSVGHKPNNFGNDDFRYERSVNSIFARLPPSELCWKDCF